MATVFLSPAACVRAENTCTVWCTRTHTRTCAHTHAHTHFPHGNCSRHLRPPHMATAVRGSCSRPRTGDVYRYSADGTYPYPYPSFMHTDTVLTDGSVSSAESYYPLLIVFFCPALYWSIQSWNNKCFYSFIFLGHFEAADHVELVTIVTPWAASANNSLK